MRRGGGWGGYGVVMGVKVLFEKGVVKGGLGGERGCLGEVFLEVFWMGGGRVVWKRWGFGGLFGWGVKKSLERVLFGKRFVERV